MPSTATHPFADERRTAIISMLDHAASVQVTDLAQAFGVSTVTVRADLDALEAAGKLRRTHGGAVSLQKRLTISVQDERVNVNVEAKQAIARTAAKLVRDGMTLVVDSGTTALEFVRTLSARSGITVITADITIADYIDEALPMVNVILLGGSLRKGHRYLYGPITMRSLEMLHADLAVVCPGSYIPGRGFMTDYPQMAELKGAIMAAATKTVSLLDASKVGAAGLMQFATIADVDTMVMDADPEGVVAADLAALEQEAPHPRLLLANEDRTLDGPHVHPVPQRK